MAFLAVTLASLLALGPGAAARPGAPKPAKGVLLVASPDLGDPNFARSVVLLLEYGQGGAVGVIVNRKTSIRLAALVPEVDALKRRPDTVFLGGPVLWNALLVLVRSAKAPAGSERVLGDVHVLTGRDAVRRTLGSSVPAARLRAYAGHAGWGAGQLDGEIERGDWLVVPGTADVVFASDPAAVWPALIERAEGQWTGTPRPRHVAQPMPCGSPLLRDRRSG